MSSHREAPATSQDPVADNTDTYAFISPDNPSTVTLITNYLPFEAPFGGPNFFEFGEDVTYHIHVDNDGDGQPNITFEFKFKTVIENTNTFLYNTGQILTIDSPNWNRKQFYSVTLIKNGTRTVLAKNLACPPSNVGTRSTPNYTANLVPGAIHTIGSSGTYGEYNESTMTVFAGQRLDGFHVDLGSVFDLAGLRPFNPAHEIPLPVMQGYDGLAGFGTQSIAVQVPIAALTSSGQVPSGVFASDAVIGVWGAATRSKATIREKDGTRVDTGGQQQVSRLGNPLFNEVIVPMSEKDYWNSQPPAKDSSFLKYVQNPELAGLLPVLYPGVFPNLAALDKAGTARADLVAILLTGLPKGIVAGFQNYTGSTYADELRLNVAVPPSKSPSVYGILGGDLAGFPNGRRPIDDVLAIELRAIAGATYGLVDPTYQPDAAAPLLADGTTDTDKNFLSNFPYLGTPYGGYQTEPLSLIAGA